jgi:hypothetical protein
VVDVSSGAEDQVDGRAGILSESGRFDQQAPAVVLALQRAI